MNWSVKGAQNCEIHCMHQFHSVLSLAFNILGTMKSYRKTQKGIEVIHKEIVGLKQILLQCTM